MDNAMQEKSNSIHFAFLSSLLIFLVCFTHPLIFILFAFVILYYYFSYPDKYSILKSFGLVYLAFYCIKFFFFKTPYDSQAMDGLNNFFTLFPNYFNLESNKNLLKFFVHDYYFVAIVFLVIMVYFIKQLQYGKAFLIAAFFLGYCLLVNVTYPDGIDQFYIENLYLVLAVIVALPFAYEVLPKIKNPHIQYGLVGLICVIGIIRITTTHSLYSERLAWFSDLLNRTESLSQKKLIIPQAMAPIDRLLMTWGSSYEFWLLSTIEKGQSRSIIIEDRPGELDWALPSNNSFITKWGVFDYSSLNSKYFILTDTTSYIKLQNYD